MHIILYTVELTECVEVKIVRMLQFEIREAVIGSLDRLGQFSEFL